MAYNGSGTFNRVHNWVTDKTNSIVITASRTDAEDDGFATGLSTAITKDGQTTITANIPFNTKKITGLLNGSARTDSIALGQVQDNTYDFLGENGGSANTYTWSPSPVITAYAAGQKWVVLIGSGDGATGASTGNISGVGSRAIEKSDGAGSETALESGDMLAGNSYTLIDDGAKLVLQNPEIPHLDGTNITNVPQAAGTTIQTVHTQTGAVATGTTTMALDDTIPPITEGNEYLTRAITPTNASNKLVIEVEAILASSFAGAIIMIGALFQDSTSAALTASFEHMGAVNSPIKITIKYEMVAGTTSPTTFKFRAGIGAAGTTTLNGQAGGRLMGGVANSIIRITEYKV